MTWGWPERISMKSRFWFFAIVKIIMWGCFALRHDSPLGFLYKPGSCEERWWGFIFAADCVCPVMQHWRALGLRGLDWGGGSAGQGLEVGQAWSSEAGGGEGVAPLGCWLALRSHLVITLFLCPEGWWRTGGRDGGIDWTSASGVCDWVGGLA